MNITAFFKLSYGMYIVTSKHENEFSGCIVNTVTQVTSTEKPKVTVAINKQNYTSEIIEKSGKINVAVLSESATFELIGKFGFRSGREFNKREACEYIIGKNGIPVVNECVVSYFEGTVLEKIEAETHNIFLIEIDEAENISDVQPMTYEYYHKVIKGKTPPKASTFNMGV